MNKKTPKRLPLSKILLLGTGILLVLLLIVGGVVKYQQQQAQQKALAEARAKQIAKAAAVDHLNQEILALRDILGMYPPEFKDDQERQATTQRLQTDVTTAKKLLSDDPSSPNAEIKWQIGELDRLGHNLDLPGVWNESESYLQQAHEADPNFYKADISLAMLYVNSDLNLAPKAEQLYLRAEPLATKDDLWTIYQGLFFADYYQGHFKDASTVLNQALKDFPNDQGFLSLQALLKK